MKRTISIFITGMLLLTACKSNQENNSETNLETSAEEDTRMKVLIDSDANNELDDQHAIAYALFNGDVFNVVGITVNNTYNGDGIEGQYAEALRVAKLCDAYPEVPVIKGAEGNYNEIIGNIGQENYDGAEAVDFIISEANKHSAENPLILLPVGKLTNIALALAKAPEIIEKVKVIWLGGHYPKAGEYNLDNDTTSVNPVIESGVHFEMVTVRYGDPSGTWGVIVTPEEIFEKMPGAGPTVEPVTGRHGGEFTNFGDYSVNLFEEAEMHGDPPGRSLFDMAAIAVVKNPAWGERKEIPAPTLVGNGWQDNPENENTIYIWENFDRDAIMQDFFETMKNYQLQ